MADVTRLVRISPATLCQDLQGEGVLLQLDTGEYFGLDEVGYRTWQLIREHGGDLARVEEQLLSEYHVEAPVLSADLERLVRELIEHKLLEPA